MKKLPLLQSRWKSEQYYLYSFMKSCYKKSEMNDLLRRCQKTSLRYAVRAAFDTEEKDVRRERCKDTIRQHHLRSYNIMKLIQSGTLDLRQQIHKEALAGWPREAIHLSECNVK